MATLYVVATPIGNLEDISPRALRILKEVSTVLCEDTRLTRKLLSHYDIHTPTLSYHANSDEGKEERIIALLREGKDLALVSDAGTPAISDPGAKLVSAVRSALGAEVSIIAVPGPSALTAALSVSGLPSSDFLFLGFLPHKKGRQSLFEEIAGSSRTVVFYESPHRLLKTLEALAEKLDSSRTLVVSREISKIYEEVVSDSPQGVRAYFEANPEKVRGEFVLMVSGRN
ncbi:MAG TPA: 16S rRNA (cytidine(1402)-2'-O)-methyltransferase [Candidatus Paceibacterota bacterium]|nr:16S rRNA (cytidine(1402)-2'-O)-methyltransferase [Candidatus Paceibacterota bacterium]